MIRHFTATGIVLHQGEVLLVEHKKLRWWMPPGGHIEPNEDPVQAVLREVREETGLDCEIVAPAVFRHHAIQVLPSPFTILVEDVPERGEMVQHIDCIYILRPAGQDPRTLDPQLTEVTAIRWVPISEVAKLDTPPELPALISVAAEAIGSGACSAGLPQASPTAPRSSRSVTACRPASSSPPAT
jgi:8-oxo-dGTP diphosphatase